jgi:hypothetical protein
MIQAGKSIDLHNQQMEILLPKEYTSWTFDPDATQLPAESDCDISLFAGMDM